jgi:hypothetical protein
MLGNARGTNCCYRRSFKYKPLQEHDSLAAANGTADLHNREEQQQDGSGSSLQADLDLAEAALAADHASTAARASTAAHKEAITAAAQVEPQVPAALLSCQSAGVECVLSVC